MPKIEVDDLPEVDDVPELDFEVPEIKLEELSASVRDACLGVFKTHGKTWKDMTEAEQRMLYEGLGKFGREFVDEAVALITGWDYPRAIGKIDTFQSTDSGGGKIVCKLSFQQIPENLTALGGHVGGMCAVLMFDAADLKNEPAEARHGIQPDQLGIPFGTTGSKAAGDALAPDVTSEDGFGVAELTSLKAALPMVLEEGEAWDPANAIMREAVLNFAWRLDPGLNMKRLRAALDYMGADSDVLHPGNADLNAQGDRGARDPDPGPEGPVVDPVLLALTEARNDLVREGEEITEEKAGEILERAAAGWPELDPAKLSSTLYELLNPDQDATVADVLAASGYGASLEIQAEAEAFEASAAELEAQKTRQRLTAGDQHSVQLDEDQPKPKRGRKPKAAAA